MKPFILLVLSAILASVSTANVWEVDQQGGGDFLTIQEAIFAAVTGDEVVVLAGRYSERIDFLGKNLWVHGAGGADATIIDAEHGGSCVLFRLGETMDAVLEGFALTGGSGTLYGSSFVGGAVFCLHASPTIRGCHFLQNVTEYGA